MKVEEHPRRLPGHVVAPPRPVLAPVLSALLILTLVSCGEKTTGPVGNNPAGPGADREAPHRVVAPVLEWHDATARAVLSWQAPSDDDAHAGPVASYDIRYSYSFPLKWAGAIVLAAPQPGSPGTPQSVDIPSPRPGRDIYAAIRSADRAGNVSPLSDLAVAHVPGITLTGQCIRAGTAQAVPALDIRVTARRVRSDVTGADGSFAQDDLTGGLVTVTISRGASPVAWHDLRSTLTLHADTSIVFPMIEFQSAPSGKFESILALLMVGDAGVSRTKMFRKWAALPVDVYVPEMTNTFGVNYAAAVRAAMDRWELRSGIDLFREVPTPPAIGVEFRYLPRSQMGIQNGFTEHFDGADKLPARDIVRILDEFTDAEKLYRVMMHELGHTIRLNHLPAGFIMYAGQPLPPDISDDEAMLVRLHVALPNRFDLSPYNGAPPSP